MCNQLKLDISNSYMKLTILHTIAYWPFQGVASFVENPFCYFCFMLTIVMLSCLFLEDSWSLAAVGREDGDSLGKYDVVHAWTSICSLDETKSASTG